MRLRHFKAYAIGRFQLPGRATPLSIATLLIAAVHLPVAAEPPANLNGGLEKAKSADEAPSRLGAAPKVPVSRPAGLMSNIAASVNAAANAANAAANAANAAAVAAAAAFEAIEVLQPGTKRKIGANKPAVGTPPDTVLQARSLMPAPTQPEEDLDKTPANAAPAALFPTSSLADASDEPSQAAEQGGGILNHRFLVPAERNLVGLVGAFEVPVQIDTDGSFMDSLAAYEPPKVIGEINLSEAIIAGLGFSRDVLASAAQVDQSSAQSGQARALLLPSMTVRKNTGKEDSTPSQRIDPSTNKVYPSLLHSRHDSVLTLRQPLLDLPSLRDWQRRKQLLQSKQSAHEAVQGDSFVATVTAYLSLVSTRVQADMAREFEGQLGELQEYLRKRTAAGAANSSDENRVKARSLSARSSRLEMDAAHAAAGIEFVRLVNLVPRSVRLPDLSDKVQALVSDNLHESIAKALQRNPDLARLQSELAAAALDRSAARGRFMPRFDLEYTDTASAGASGDTTPIKEKRLMVVMNWSLLNGGGDLHYYDERAARYREIQYRLDDQRRKTVQTLSAQYATLSATRDRLKVGYRELESIANAANAVAKRMVSGNQSLLDVLDVFERYYQARVRLVNLHVLELSTVIQIVRLVEGLTPMDGEAQSTNTATQAPTSAPAGFKPTALTVPADLKTTQRVEAPEMTLSDSPPRGALTSLQVLPGASVNSEKVTAPLNQPAQPMDFMKTSWEITAPSPQPTVAAALPAIAPSRKTGWWQKVF